MLSRLVKILLRCHPIKSSLRIGAGIVVDKQIERGVRRGIAQGRDNLVRGGIDIVLWRIAHEEQQIGGLGELQKDGAVFLRHKTRVGEERVAVALLKADLAVEQKRFSV